MTLHDSLERIQAAISDYLTVNEKSISAELFQRKPLPSQSSPVTDIQPNVWGIYSFHVQFDIPPINYQDLKTFWRKTSDGTNLYCPDLIKSRCPECFDSNSSYCLYVGKSHNLVSRINQHINHTTAKSTYSLKLSDQNIFKEKFKPTFFYSYFPITTSGSSQNKMAHEAILVNTEARMRSMLKPLIGKQ